MHETTLFDIPGQCHTEEKLSFFFFSFVVLEFVVERRKTEIPFSGFKHHVNESTYSP
jgi:hypothetical protein